MKNCHVCNQLCDDKAEVCPICGALLLEEQEVNEQETSEVKIKPVLLATFEDVVSAEIFKDILTDNSVPYSAPQEESMRVVFGGAFSSEEIYVDEQDFDKARELYTEFLESETAFDGDFEDFTEE